MATASKTYTFTTLTTAQASQVNQNFDDLVAFLNGSVIHKDASVAFTGVPSGPASDPSTDNQFARKGYVDAGALLRLKFLDDDNAMKGTYSGGTQLQWIAGYQVVTTTAGGVGTVTFPTAFPTGLLVALPIVGDTAGAGGVTSVAVFNPAGSSKTSFQCVPFAGTATLPSTAVRINYLAIGW